MHRLPWPLPTNAVCPAAEELVPPPPPPLQVVDAGAVPLLVLCVQEPELAVKRIAASALGDVAKHSPELAQVGRHCAPLDLIR